MNILSNGYIKLHRKLLNNPIMYKPELLQLFIYCIYRANITDERALFNGQEITVPRGSFITGRFALAGALGQNPRTTYDRLKVLENLNIISIKSNNKFSLVTIVNYGLYQNVPEEYNNKPTTNQQQTNNKPTQLKNYKNYKNIRIKECVLLSETEYKSLCDEITEEKTLSYASQLNNYILKIGQDEAKKRYKSHYATIKSWYERDIEQSKSVKAQKGNSVINKSNFDQRSYTEQEFEDFYKEV